MLMIVTHKSHNISWINPLHSSSILSPSTTPISSGIKSLSIRHPPSMLNNHPNNNNNSNSQLVLRIAAPLSLLSTNRLVSAPSTFLSILTQQNPLLVHSRYSPRWMPLCHCCMPSQLRDCRSSPFNFNTQSIKRCYEMSMMVDARIPSPEGYSIMISVIVWVCVMILIEASN
jgi:hypothetical protein